MLSTFEFSGNVVGIMVNADVDQALLEEIHQKIKERFTEHHMLNLFVEVEKGADIPFYILIKDLHFKLSNAGEFRKVAVVTDNSKFELVIKLKDFLLQAEVQAYTHEERLDAIQWITK